MYVRPPTEYRLLERVERPDDKHYYTAVINASREDRAVSILDGYFRYRGAFEMVMMMGMENTWLYNTNGGSDLPI